MEKEILINKEKNLKVVREENSILLYKETEVIIKSSPENFLEFFDSFVEESDNDKITQDVILLYMQIHQNINFDLAFKYLDKNENEDEDIITINLLEKKIVNKGENFDISYLFDYYDHLQENGEQETGNKIESTIRFDKNNSSEFLTSKLYLLKQLSILFKQERYNSVYENVEYRPIDKFNKEGYYYNRFTGKRIK